MTKNQDSTAIDFHQLMLQEKKRIRNQRKKTKKKDLVVTANDSTRNDHSRTITLNNHGVVVDGEHNSTPTESQPMDKAEWLLQDLPFLDRSKYVVTSRSNDTSTDTCTKTRMPSSVYYISQFLHQDDGYQKRLLTWLQGLPNNEDNNDNHAMDHSSKDHNTNKDPNAKWTTMKYGKRRVALFDGITHELPIPLKEICNALVSCGIFESHAPPNHVLVNEYSPTQGIMPHTDGPMYKDTTATISIGGGDVLLKFTPRRRLPTDDPNIVTTMKNDNSSLSPLNQMFDGSSNNMQSREEKKTCSTSKQKQQQQQQKVDVSPPSSISSELCLEGHGSLVVFEGDAYTKYCHGIDDRVSVEYAGTNCTNANPGQLVTRGYRVSLTFRHKLFHST